jgi:hypothetical protein
MSSHPARSAASPVGCAARPGVVGIKGLLSSKARADGLVTDPQTASARGLLMESVVTLLGCFCLRGVRGLQASFRREAVDPADELCAPGKEMPHGAGGASNSGSSRVTRDSL